MPPVPPIADTKLPAIAIGLLSYNRCEEVLRTLDALATTDYPQDRLHLIVIDNASTDGTAERVRERWGSRVEVVESPSNVGVAARNEVLLRRAERYVFCFDEDCQPADRWTIRRAVEIFEAHPWIGALCLRCINQHTGETELGDYRSIARHRVGDWGYEGLSVIGAGMGFRGSMIRRTRGYDPRLFWGGEELQLTLELLHHEIPIVYVPDLALIHRQAPRALSTHAASAQFMRNHALTYFTFLSLPVAALIVAIHTARNLLASLVRRRGAGSLALLKAVATALADVPRLVPQRRLIPLARLIGYRRWIVSSLTVTPRSAPEPADAERVARSRRQSNVDEYA